MDELVTGLEDFDRDEESRCIVLTGSARAFAAGADIREFADASAVDMLQGYRFQQWEHIRKVTKPLIAAVTGFALGGGNELGAPGGEGPGQGDRGPGARGGPVGERSSSQSLRHDPGGRVGL